MALHFNARIGPTVVGSFYAHRKEEGEGRKRTDVVNTYSVRIDDWEGEVRHRYGDGAWVLIEKALRARRESEERER